jgi:large subunit ribosomal protein L9
MEIILREDVEKLGTRGQVVKVAAGYARNFLLPKRLAVAATDSNKKIVEQERQAHLRKEVLQKTEAEDLAKTPELRFHFDCAQGRRKRPVVRIGNRGDIADALEAQKFNIDRRKIQLDEAIRALGDYKVTLRLHREVSAEVTVSVVAEA